MRGGGASVRTGFDLIFYKHEWPARRATSSDLDGVQMVVVMSRELSGTTTSKLTWRNSRALWLFAATSS